MKRATSGIIFTGFFELNASVDDLDNIEAIEQVVSESLRKSCHSIGRLESLYLAPSLPTAQMNESKRENSVDLRREEGKQCVM